jgi:ribosomal protein L39E
MTTKNPALAKMLKNAQENKHSSRAPLIVRVKTQRMLENEALEEKVINKIRKVAR